MEIIEIKTNENEEPVVSGRQLHERLEVATPFKKWIDRMLEYGFTENIDFVTVDKNVYGKNGQLMPQKESEYYLSLDTAKEIAMLQRNEKGQEIRRYFIQVEKEFNSPEKIMARALKIADRKMKQLEMKVEEDRPKVAFANALLVSDKSILVGEMAKILKQNGIEIGQKRLFEWLRVNDYLCSRGEEYNLPTQKAMNLKVMEVKRTVTNNPDGTSRVNRTTKITPKGQEYFINKFLKAKEEERNAN